MPFAINNLPFTIFFLFSVVKIDAFQFSFAPLHIVVYLIANRGVDGRLLVFGEPFFPARVGALIGVFAAALFPCVIAEAVGER